MTGLASLLAVHISDGVLAPWAAGVSTVLALALLAVGGRSIADEELPRLGVFTAALFVASQIHFPVAPGITVHLLLNAVAGIILGFRAAVAVAVAVFLQALLFGHGGLTSWGINTLTMSLPAVVAGTVFRFLDRRRPNYRIVSGAVIGVATSSATVLLAAAAVDFLGVESRWVSLTVVITHLPVIGLEGFITASIVAYLSRAQPEWLGRFNQLPPA